MIHPGAQWQTKRWPPEHFAVLAHRAQEIHRVGVVLVGGPGDAPLCSQIESRLTGPVANLAERTDLLQLAALSARADVFLSGDTGPMHLAAAAGARVVSVFTCTSPLRAGPRGNHERVVAASYRKRCNSLICMQELLPHRVWPVLNAALTEATAFPRQLQVA
jgi:ADP-heptose:LPS heptosyltransferase